jgi:methyl-galactoside transport system ATP-binding protein
MVSTNTQSSREFLLEMSNINKSFPGVKALDNVNLKVRPHSIHALMGENGAGKLCVAVLSHALWEKANLRQHHDGQQRGQHKPRHVPFSVRCNDDRRQQWPQ